MNPYWSSFKGKCIVLFTEYITNMFDIIALIFYVYHHNF